MTQEEALAEANVRITRAVQPEIYRRLETIREKNIRFVHYTSAEAGLAILRTGRMLLRNSALLNDFSEVEHGRACLAHAYQSEHGERLKALMREVKPDLPEIFEKSYGDMFRDLRNEAYLISVSEHGDLERGDAFEDAFGRLSMWRAYANSNGIAFVFNHGPFARESNAINAYTSPVVYEAPDGFLPHFKEVVDGFESVMDVLKPAGGTFFHELLSFIFRFATQSTKHRAFCEEREWRVIYSPSLLRREGKMTAQQLERIPTEIMTIRGVPQRVYAIPFKDYPDEGFEGATVPDLFDRLLIGPSPDAYAIAQAFVAELSANGVENAHERVVITDIPLRI